MAKLGTVLDRQFKKLGIEISEDLKPLVALDTEISDEIAGKIDKGLLTIEAAKTNPDVTKAVKASALNGIDTKIEDIIKEHSVTVDEAFANEKNTYEKVGLLSKILFETGKKKGEANSKEGLSESVKKERDEFQKKEAEYQKQLKEKTDALTAKENEYKSSSESQRTTYEMHKKLFGKDYVFPKEMDTDLKVEAALSAINKDLRSKGLTAKLNEAGVLVITDKDGQPAYTEKHEPITDAGSYFDEILTRNKLLNVNDPNVQTTPQGSPGAGIIPGQQGQIKNAHIVKELDAQIANMPS